LDTQVKVYRDVSDDDDDDDDDDLCLPSTAFCFRVSSQKDCCASYHNFFP